MAYIGKTPIVGNFQKCDAISVVNGQAAYTMQVGGSNVSPESENHMLVSLNGILQAPVDSFTISGSTITFASNLVTGDVIDFIMLLGNVLDLGTPSDNTVTAAKIGANAVTSAKLNNDIISGATELASEPADTDEFLISDAGVLKRLDYSLIKASSALTKISTTTISNAASSTLDVFTSTYRNYRIIGSGFTPASDDVNLNIELFQADDTEASNYYWAGIIIDDDGSSGGARSQRGGTAANEFRIFEGADTAGDASQVNFDMMVYQPQIAADTAVSVQSAGRSNPNRGSIQNFGGFGGSTSVMTKIKFSFSSGNIANGVVTVYGLEN